MDKIAHTVVIRDILVRLVLNCMATLNGELLSKINVIHPVMILVMDSKLRIRVIHTKDILGRGTKRGGLYYVDDFSPDIDNSVMHPSYRKHKKIWLCHRRLGHLSFSYLKHLIPDLCSGLKDSNFKCDTCILAKSHRVPYPLSTNKCTTPFMLIHSNVWGPSLIIAHSGVRWFVTFVDAWTWMT
ncbi:unnamed protein product [Prunus armeniaca]